MSAPANKYRGQIILPFQGGDLPTVVDANALRLYMEELGQSDISEALGEIQSNPLDRVPRLLYHGHRNALYLGDDAEAKPMAWERFAAQCGQLDFQQVVQDTSAALELWADSQKKATEAAPAAP